MFLNIYLLNENSLTSASQFRLGLYRLHSLLYIFILKRFVVVVLWLCCHFFVLWIIPQK